MGKPSEAAASAKHWVCTGDFFVKTPHGSTRAMLEADQARLDREIDALCQIGDLGFAIGSPLAGREHQADEGCADSPGRSAAAPRASVEVMCDVLCNL